jgi:hypothetical protein
MRRNLVSRNVATGLAVIAVCMAAGCATTDTVSSRFPQLVDNINAAKAAEAQTFAPAPLKSAETKLEAAKAAVVAKDMVAANRYVDEAMVDADYAKAMAPTEKARNEVMKLREAIQAVHNDIKKLPPLK